MKYLLTILMMVLPHLAQAQQSLGKMGKSVEEIVPTGWEHSHAVGDLNKDGIADLVIAATPDDKEHIIIRESDGYQYNLNQPILGIYWGHSDGTYTCWKTYDNVLLARPDEYISIDNTLDITDRGVLTIDIESFATMGSWGTGHTTYLFRYQNNDFYLIGKDENSIMRNSGEVTIDSYNYLTYRHQKITFNEFDKNVKKKEKWEKMLKAPLKKLGTFELEN